jgi:hypothetical protein
VRVLLVLSILLAAAANATAEDYLWTISASATDPYMNTGAPNPGVLTTLHVWLACSTMGMSAAIFELEADGMTVLAFTPCCGFLNVGAPSPCLLLATGGCPSGPIRAGELLVLDFVGGRVCPIPCRFEEDNYTVDCGPEPEIHLNAWIGYASDGSAPCAQGFCGPISVEDESWGRVKGLYR